MAKITIASLKKEIEQLNISLSEKNQIIGKISDKLDVRSYATVTEIIAAIAELQGAAEVYKKMRDNYEGIESRLVADLKEENSKLWYFMRIALKDDSAQKTVFKPGDQRRPDMLGEIIRPFRERI